MIKFFFLFIFLSFPLFLHADSALIFNGAGVCEGCAESIGKILIEKKYNIKYINEKTLNDFELNNANLYVQPGGSDDITETIKALSPEQIKSIQNFINDGGKYLGVCAGAYLAAKYADYELKIFGFNLIELNELEQELPHTDKAKLISISFPNTKNSRKVYYQAGPHFGKNISGDTKIYSYYSKSGNIASRISSYGKGKVGLIGPHYEADEEWYHDDHLTLKYGLNIDLFHQFLDELK